MYYAYIDQINNCLANEDLSFILSHPLFFRKKKLLMPFKTFYFLQYELQILRFDVIIPFPDTAGLDTILAMTVIHYEWSVVISQSTPSPLSKLMHAHLISTWVLPPPMSSTSLSFPNHWQWCKNNDGTITVNLYLLPSRFKTLGKTCISEN